MPAPPSPHSPRVEIFLTVSAFVATGACVALLWLFELWIVAIYGAIPFFISWVWCLGELFERVGRIKDAEK